MPKRKQIEYAKRAKRQGKSPSTQAGEFVREEIHHVREGKHGARSTKQAIAIGLSMARRAGVKIPRPPGKKGSRKSPPKRRGKPSPTRARAALRALKRESHSAASHEALARHAHRSAMKRSSAQRSASARKAARTRSRRSG